MWQNTRTPISVRWQKNLDAAKAEFGMRWNGWESREKKTTRYAEQDAEKVAAYQEEIKDIPPEKIAYVDECGIDTYLYREYGYAPRNQRVFDCISGRKFERCGIVAA